ncbi:conjugated polyketone reductase C1 [Punctularia strigosozonata HHB-11173 SS5]|uniref:Conjugated polyketone reductase C1 n=1 Tax=Punctularia strigosozonata (strain HHB-11173) TaxID=741275 RepID=R7S569_PUNST|nr:conjugated polyketone reductase C1 [Punctularia strigosozonata HHB-11173 SS5]EIN05022.1 conjugated polyketone reductase C1 [Punctularia strigosozonata HHB-11173 SS5]
MAHISTTFKLLDGAEIPWLAWGTGSGKARTDPVGFGKLVIEAGLRHIDTAQGYDNEKETGEFVAEAASSVPREKIWITSKLSHKGEDPVPVSEIRQSVAETTERLGTVPDLFLIHNPFVPPAGDLVAAWKELEALKDEGKLKSIGVSNFRPQDLELILANAKHKPVANQIEYHPYVLTHLEPVLAIHEQHGIVVEAFGPLVPLIKHPNGGPIKPILERIAARLSKESGQAVDAATVLLLWTKAMGVVAVSSSGNADNIKRLAATYTSPLHLTSEEVKEISDVGRTVHFRHYTEHMEVDFPLPNLPSQ